MGLTIGSGDTYFRYSTTNKTNSNSSKLETKDSSSEEVKGSSHHKSVLIFDRPEKAAYLDGVRLDYNFINMRNSRKSYDEIMSILPKNKEYVDKSEEILKKIIESKL